MHSTERVTPWWWNRAAACGDLCPLRNPALQKGYSDEPSHEHRPYDRRRVSDRIHVCTGLDLRLCADGNGCRLEWIRDSNSVTSLPRRRGSLFGREARALKSTVRRGEDPAPAVKPIRWTFAARRGRGAVSRQAHASSAEQDGRPFTADLDCACRTILCQNLRNGIPMSIDVD